MGSRGPGPRKIVNTKWSANLAYAIGLITTDGCLASNSSLIDLTSKDKEQLENFMNALNLKLKIGKKSSGSKKEKTYYRVQFKSRLFYDFLLSIGLHPKKSLNLGKIILPDKYFFNFLRGCFDGDGYSYSYWDSRWKSSFMLYVCFVSASSIFVDWIRYKIYQKLKIKGHISSVTKKNKYYQLKYSKKDSMCLIKEMYKGKNNIFLSRKKLKINKSLSIIGCELV